MQIKNIMTKSPETVNANSNLMEVARKMNDLQVGALPVWDVDEVIGIITDRDITIRSTAEGQDPSSVCAKDIMTQDVIYCFEDDDITQAATVMEQESVHRLLIVNSNNEPVGFLSLSDFAVKSHDEHLTCEVLERISEPACPNR